MLLSDEKARFVWANKHNALHFFVPFAMLSLPQNMFIFNFQKLKFGVCQKVLL